jgi:hypothetical protein
MAVRHRRSTLATMALVTFIGLALIDPSARADRADGPTPDRPACGEYRQLRAMLAERFGEEPTSAGLAENGTIMQVFASATAATWTMVKVDATGRACVFAVGRHWEQQNLVPGGKPA